MKQGDGGMRLRRRSYSRALARSAFELLLRTRSSLLSSPSLSSFSSFAPSILSLATLWLCTMQALYIRWRRRKSRPTPDTWPHHAHRHLGHDHPTSRRTNPHGARPSLEKDHAPLSRPHKVSVRACVSRLGRTWAGLVACHGSAFKRTLHNEDPITDRQDTSSRLESPRDLMHTHGLDYEYVAAHTIPFLRR